MNCITHKIDSTHHPAAKMSPSLARMINTFSMSDSFRILYLTSKTFSHHYHTTQQGTGTTRIGRSYSWGEMCTVEAKYVPIAFSDHMAYVVSFSLPVPYARIFSPRSRPQFKIRPEVICDPVFQEWLADSMVDWKKVKDLGIRVFESRNLQSREANN